MDAKSLRRKRIDSFLILSQKDVAAAKRMLPDLSEHAAFHLQQAAEKIVRAVLEYEQIVGANSHNIRQLTELLPIEHEWREKFGRLDRLSSALRDIVIPHRAETSCNPMKAWLVTTSLR